MFLFPISMNINMSAQAPEEEAQDPYCIKYIELKYKDGTSYVSTIRTNSTTQATSAA